MTRKNPRVCSKSYLQEWNCHHKSQSFHCGIPSWLEASFIRFRRGLSTICCIEKLQVTPNMRRYIVVIVFMSKFLIRMSHFSLLYFVFIWKGLLYPNIDLLKDTLFVQTTCLYLASKHWNKRLYKIYLVFRCHPSTKTE